MVLVKKAQGVIVSPWFAPAVVLQSSAESGGALAAWLVVAYHATGQLSPVDDAMREQMLQEALDSFLEVRVNRVLAGEAARLDPIHYDPET